MRASWSGKITRLKEESERKAKSWSEKKARKELNRSRRIPRKTVANNAAMQNARFTAHNYERTTWVPMGGNGRKQRNLDTTELLQERNVRDRGDLNEACENADGGSPLGKERKRKSEK